jgi:alpha-tubulin suppressor-like RCC1 family protein
MDGALSPWGEETTSQLVANESLTGYCSALFTPDICNFPVSAAFTWSSLDTSVATVSGNGLVHARSAGSTTITAADHANSVSAQFTLDVVHVTRISLTPTDVTLLPGGVRALVFSAMDSSTGAIANLVSITWHSSNSAVAAVDSTGLVTALAVGQTVVTATTGNNVSGTSAVTVAETGKLTFTALSAGFKYTCGISKTGAAYCWGFGVNGNLGNDTLSYNGDGHPFPLLVSGATSFSTISIGNWTSCALTKGGVAWCWGANYEGEVGDGTTSDRTVPSAIAGGATYRSVSTGSDHACAVREDATVVCWGAGYFGQLGTAPPSICPGAGAEVPCATSPIAVQGGLHFSSVSAALEHTCGIADTGEAYCWGANDANQLGTMSAGTCVILGGESRPCSTVPVLVSGTTRFASIRAGFRHTCALTSAGQAYCWGANDAGQLGNPGADSVTPAPLPVAGGLTFTEISSGNDATCGLTTAGDVYCWGGWFGANGPSLVKGGHQFRSITVGFDHACGLTALGAAYCWGNADKGQLGNGIFYPPSDFPVPVSDPE